MTGWFDLADSVTEANIPDFTSMYSCQEIMINMTEQIILNGTVTK